MTGRALDFAVNNLDQQQRDLIETATKSLGATYIYENELYWGQDRLDYLEDKIK